MEIFRSLLDLQRSQAGIKGCLHYVLKMDDSLSDILNWVTKSIHRLSGNTVSSRYNRNSIRKARKQSKSVRISMRAIDCPRYGGSPPLRHKQTHKHPYDYLM